MFYISVVDWEGIKCIYLEKVKFFPQNRVYKFISKTV